MSRHKNDLHLAATNFRGKIDEIIIENDKTCNVT